MPNLRVTSFWQWHSVTPQDVGRPPRTNTDEVRVSGSSWCHLSSPWLCKCNLLQIECKEMTQLNSITFNHSIQQIQYQPRMKKSFKGTNVPLQVKSLRKHNRNIQSRTKTSTKSVLTPRESNPSQMLVVQHTAGCHTLLLLASSFACLPILSFWAVLPFPAQDLSACARGPT